MQGVRASRVTVLLLFISVLLLALPTMHAQVQGVIAIKDGKVLTITKGVLERGTVLIRDSKIEAVGTDIPIPKEARVIDARGMWVYPGLIDSQTQLGLVEVEMVEATRDLIEPSDEVTPHMHTRDAFHAESALIEVTRVNGITTALVAPAETNTLPGQSTLIHLSGKNADEMVFVPDVALHINFGPEPRRREKFPATRMGLIAQLRQTFVDAQNYVKRKKRAEAESAAGQGATQNEEGEEEGARAFKHDLKLEALLPYLNREKPAIVTAHTGSDLETIVRLLREFNFRIVLNHITYAQDVLDEVASWRVPVLVGPIYDAPLEEQRYDAIYRLPAELFKRGVLFAFESDDAHNARNLPYQAGYAVAWGVPHEEALKALTINPAKIFGVDNQIGSLEVGKLANVVVADGDPLEPRTAVKYVFIKGHEVPLTNRQLRLYQQHSGR